MLQPTETFHLCVVQSAHLFLCGSDSFPREALSCYSIIIKVITSSYMAVTISRYCPTCFTGIHWFILLLTHLFSNGGTEAEGALSHQQMSVVGVGLQTQAGWHHLIDSFFSTFSPHLRLYSVRGVYSILEDSVLYDLELHFLSDWMVGCSAVSQIATLPLLMWEALFIVPHL